MRRRTTAPTPEWQGVYLWKRALGPIEAALPLLQEGDLLNVGRIADDPAVVYRVLRDPASGLLYGWTPIDDDHAPLRPWRNGEDRLDAHLGIRIEMIGREHNRPWNLWASSVFSLFREGYGDLEVGEDDGC